MTFYDKKSWFQRRAIWKMLLTLKWKKHFLLEILLNLVTSVDGFVTQMEYCRIIILGAKHLYLESAGKKLFFATFFPSICVFYRPDKNDVVKSRNCYKTSSVGSYYLKLCTKQGSNICQLTANIYVDHITDM